MAKRRTSITISTELLDILKLLTNNKSAYVEKLVLSAAKREAVSIIDKEERQAMIQAMIALENAAIENKIAVSSARRINAHKRYAKGKSKDV